MVKTSNSNLLKDIVENVNLVIITQTGSSGSNLIHSLLDNHSELYVMPIHFKYPLWSQIIADDHDNFWDGHTAVSKVLSEFLDLYPIFSGENNSCKSIVDVCGKVDPWLVALKFWILFDYLFAGSDSPVMRRRDFIILLHVAFHWAIHGSFEKRKHIVVHIHGYECGAHERALDDFPSLKLISSTRDLRQHCASYKQKRITKKPLANFQEARDIYFAQYAFQWHYYVRNLIRLTNIFGEANVLRLDLESIHASPQIFKNKITSFLDISAETTLDQSTFLGKTWVLSGDSRDFSGLSKAKSRYTWSSILDATEINFLYEYMGEALIKLGYAESNQFNPSESDSKSYRFSCIDSFINQPSIAIAERIVDIQLKAIDTELTFEHRQKLIEYFSETIASPFATKISFFDRDKSSWTKDSSVLSYSHNRLAEKLYNFPPFLEIFTQKRINPYDYAFAIISLIAITFNVSIQARIAKSWEKEQFSSKPIIFN